MGGVAIAIWGIGGSFVVQGLLLGVGLIALLPLKVPVASPGAQPQRARLRADVAEGIRFVARTADIRMLIILLLMGALLIGGPLGHLAPQARERRAWGRGVWREHAVRGDGLGDPCSPPCCWHRWDT